MEDDWASPWADAHDRSPTEVIKKLDARDDDADNATKSGDEPERRLPGGNIAVHENDPWGGGEHGFGDTSAWASPSPAVRPGGTPAVGGRSGLPRWDGPVGVEIPSFVVKETADEKRRSLNAIRETVQETGTGEPGEWFRDGSGIQKTSLNLPTTATDEADVWAAGSDWGDTKSEKAEEPPLNKGASPEISPENIPLPELDTSTEGVDETVPIQESNREDQFINTTVSDHESAEHEIRANAKEESAELKGTSIEDVPPLLGLGIDVSQGTREGGESENRTETTHDDVENSPPKEELKEEEGSDDDFGDFADEEDFEDAQENLPEETTASISELPPLPPTPRLRLDITFDIQTSLVNKLYPIFTTYPEPPPIEEELIYSTDSRKAWYRLSQSSTIRKDKSGDDDYVRVTWHGSKVQEDVGKIVARWMTEDRNSGSGVALGGSRRLGAMFGWGEGVEQKAAPAPLNLLKGNTSGRGSIESLGLGGQGAEKSPSGISTTMASPAESGVVSSPQTTSFGWSSTRNTQPTVESSHPGSNLTHSRALSRSLAAVGEDKPPSTSSRASSNGTQNPPGISSQPVTPSGSTKSDSPISGNHSKQPSHTHSLAPTRPSSPQGVRISTEIVETTLIPEARTDSPLPSTSAVSNPVDHTPRETSASAPGTNFDEWHALEIMTTTAKLPSAKEANCDFEEWGSLDDFAKAEDPKIADVEVTSSVGVQDQISGLPVKPSETEDRSKEDEWSAFEEPGTASKTTSLDKSSARSSPQIPAKLENKENLDNGSTLAALKDPLTINSPYEQQLAHAHTKSTESSGPSARKTDDWGSFDVFEGALASSSATSVPPPTDISLGLMTKSIKAPDPKAQITDNWGSFEAFESTLTPQPSISNQSLRMSFIQSPKKLNVNPTDNPSFEGSKQGPWGPFGAPEQPRPKTTGNINLPALSILSGPAIKLPILPVFPASPAPPAPPAPTVGEDDDDDWGEMVQSPQVPDAGSCFSSALRPTSSTPRAMSPALSQPTQPTLPPQPASTTLMYDFSSFETKTPVPERNSKPTNGGGTDTWDLSFFDGPMAANKVPAGVTTSSQHGSDLWDAPAPVVVGRRMNAREAEEDGIVRAIVDGLPDLGYMLQQR